MTPRTALLLVASVVLVTGCTSPRHAAPAASPSASPLAGPTTRATPTTTPTPADSLSPSPAVESPAPLGQPQCQAAAVTVTDADAITTDHATQELFVLRTEGRPCQLDGWPTVGLLDTTGTPMALRVQAGGYDLPTYTPSAVTLSPSTSLSFFVATARTGACASAGTLLVTLPGTTTQLQTPTALSVCGGGIGVSPVHRLADNEAAQG